MARKKGEITGMKSWDDVNKTLKQLGEIECRKAALNAQINQKTEQERLEIADLEMQEKKLFVEMESFARTNRCDFGKSKQKVLTFGTVNFRSSTVLEIKDPDKTMEILKAKRKFKAYIKVKEEIDKAALKKLDATVLAELGATLETRETFDYKVDKVGAQCHI